MIFMIAVKVSIIRRMVALSTIFLGVRDAEEVDRDYQIIHGSKKYRVANNYENPGFKNSSKYRIPVTGDLDSTL